MDSTREIDARVAEIVMGWTNIRPALDSMRHPETNEWWEDIWGDEPGAKGNPYCIPAYSTDPTAMMEVLEEMRAEGWRWFYDYRPDAGPEFAHAFRFIRGSEIHRADAPTLPMAVSLAAIDAMEDA